MVASAARPVGPAVSVVFRRKTVDSFKNVALEKRWKILFGFFE